jgi:Mn-dependent DtxR family transcriptional regulator
MTPPVPRDVLLKVRKVALLAEEVRQSRWGVSVTRLTTLKSLCHVPEVAHRFVTYLSDKTLRRVRQGTGHSSHPDSDEQRTHRALMVEALAEMRSWLAEPTAERRQRLGELLHGLQQQQNEYRNIPWGAVRLINDWDLLIFEYALRCLLAPPGQVGALAYQTARDYAERSTASAAFGLTAKSAPLLQDIVTFWLQEYQLDAAALTKPAGAKRGERKRAATRVGKRATAQMKKSRFTARQGQFLAFIHAYWKLHRQGPAETDLVKYFRVTPPSAHAMIVKLEELGLITREPGVARSVRVSIPEAHLPSLAEVQAPPW